MPDEAGERLRAALADRYEIQRELGSGGMARVYLARDVKHDRPVAIKVLRPELAAAIGQERFLREIAIAARLTHPHVLGLHDSGTAGDALYYVMPYVEGETLRERLDRERQLPLADALRIAGEVSSALSYAHSHDIVHRDIKPANILLSGGHAVVADFGIARAISAAGGQRLTETGMTLGTAAYMSPEQAAGEALDARSDLYSLACVVYEMLAGQPPFTAGTAVSLIQQHLTADAPRVSSLRSSVPDEVADVLQRALAKTPADRFVTVAAFAEGLERAAQARRPAAAEARPRRRPGLRLLVPMTVAGLLVILTGARLMLSSSPAIPFDERDWVVIADVENLTGDSVFDRSLALALAAGVGQSPRVNVLPRNRMGEVLQRMGKAPETPVDVDVAREIAEREASRVVLASAIARIDDAYVITARFVHPATGQELETMSERASGRSDVLRALDALTRTIRRDLGESRVSVLRRSVPLPQATTPSLAALKTFSEGSRAWFAGEYRQAAELWRQAVTEDSTFAWAHASLGLHYAWNNNRPRAEEHFGRALAQLDRLTPREALWIRSLVAGSRGNWEEAIELLRTFVRRYPDDRDAWYNLGSDYMRLRRCDEAAEALSNAIALDSTMAQAHIQIATCYASSDPARAVEHYGRAFAARPAMLTEGNLNHEYGMTLARLGQLDSAEAVFRLMLDEAPGDQARGRRSLALLAMFRGRYGWAVEELRQAARLNQVAGYRLSEMRDRLLLSGAYQVMGRQDAARRELEAAEALHRQTPMEPYWLLLLGKEYVRAGNVGKGRALLEAMNPTMVGGNLRDRATQQLLAGEIALAEGRSAEALDLLEQAATGRTDVYARESLAYAHGATGDLDRAVAIYQDMIADTSLGWEGQEPWILAHYSLGRVQEQRGAPREALSAYQAFLAIWGNPDPDLPAVRDARERMLALRRTLRID